MKNRKLKGRPIKDNSIKKSKKVTVKFSEKEYHNLMEKVKQSQATVSTFIREIVHHGEVKERLSKETLFFIRQLSGMANNLNQLAKQANRQGLLYLSDNCIRVSSKIDDLLNRIKQ